MCECRCEIQEPEFDGDDGERACAAGAMTSSTGEANILTEALWNDLRRSFPKKKKDPPKGSFLILCDAAVDERQQKALRLRPEFCMEPRPVVIDRLSFTRNIARQVPEKEKDRKCESVPVADPSGFPLASHEQRPAFAHCAYRPSSRKQREPRRRSANQWKRLDTGRLLDSRYGDADADCIRTYASATGLTKADDREEMRNDVEAEKAARGTDEATNQAGPRDSLAPSCGEASKRNAPADEEAQGDSAGSVNQPAAQALPVALGVDTGKGDTPTLPEDVGDTSMSYVVTVKASESSPAPKDGERKDGNELLVEKSGVQALTNVAAAPKRPHPAASNESAETTTPGLEEPPAKTLQGRRPSIRPRSIFPADKRGGNVEPVGQSTAPPGGTAGDSTV
ncbi:hypothetical protein MRX96_021300 [Rhipicephalus microplus]